MTAPIPTAGKHYRLSTAEVLYDSDTPFLFAGEYHMSDTVSACSKQEKDEPRQKHWGDHVGTVRCKIAVLVNLTKITYSLPKSLYAEVHEPQKAMTRPGDSTTRLFSAIMLWILLKLTARN